MNEIDVVTTYFRLKREAKMLGFELGIDSVDGAPQFSIGNDRIHFSGSLERITGFLTGYQLAEFGFENE